ncbi:hypothetical protein TH63_06975 [Rufibacter radiotolerans]|uniref:DUF5667 domain-containing protein n=1 Tax=Rufibacter radiotolerans TaxID=1379910 RepID=A0A0H4W4T6_9BACT|nr:hypothetical protein [Rufibacter radiotolerans]AKQ45441.1 hypothetical protein TH63_06975 [Rufibacter radiotolerans]
MKKFILSALFLGAIFTAQAQTNLTGTAATVRTVLSMSATEMSRQMYNDLQLNEGQYVKIKALNQARLDKFSEIEKMYANDAQMRDAKIKEVNAQLDQEFAAILTPKQFTAYLEFDGRPVQTSTTTDSSSTSGVMNMNSSTATEAEMKIKDDKIKMESADSKVKIEDNKIKAESAHGEMKMKNDSEKLKTKSVKYKSSPSETKIITPEGKTKVEHDKMKAKTDTSKKKVKN